MVTKKRVLITAGQTWVAIDRARVISNISSGHTGCILAEKFRSLGLKVTLLLGPGNFCIASSGIRIIRFHYFSELQALLKKELRSSKYAAVIHSAAVSDYRPDKIITGKINSGRKIWRINLVPTKKLIAIFKDFTSNLLTVGFKFEPLLNKTSLIKKGGQFLKQAGLDLVVANSNKNKCYTAYILNHRKHYGPFHRKAGMANHLVKLVMKELL
ncbi:MAG: phosphopantothenoylcysteine decarboxylase [Candidatus Omnitrophica bacterium]|nr:phosphopantothenoylcysteine decarboxylase [Candidatus Omnitrophota bacterium]